MSFSVVPGPSLVSSVLPGPVEVRPMLYVPTKKPPREPAVNVSELHRRLGRLAGLDGMTIDALALCLWTLDPATYCPPTQRLDDEPTRALPGSEERQRVYTRRIAAGLPVHHADDLRSPALVGEGRPGPTVATDEGERVTASVLERRLALLADRLPADLWALVADAVRRW